MGAWSCGRRSGSTGHRRERAREREQREGERDNVERWRNGIGWVSSRAFLCTCARPLGPLPQAAWREAQEDYRVDMGAVFVIGPRPTQEQHRTCVAGQECRLRRLTGVDLSAGDRYALLDTCASPTAVVAAAPMGGVLRRWARDASSARFASVDFAAVAMTISGGRYRQRRGRTRKRAHAPAHSLPLLHYELAAMSTTFGFDGGDYFATDSR